MKPLVLQVRYSSTKRDISMHSAAQYGSGTSSTSDWKDQRKAWVAEQRQRRRASRAPQQRLQRSHLDEDVLATGSRFSAFPRMIKALDRHSMESESNPVDGGIPESRYRRPRAPLNRDPSSQGAFAPRNTSTHHRRPSNSSSAADSPITAPVMRNRDLIEPVYDDRLGSSPQQLQDSYTSSGLPYDSPPPSYRSSRARNETALNRCSTNRSELALRRYAHDEAMPDTYRADGYTPRQQIRQIPDARNAAWPSRSGARSVRFPGLQQPSHFCDNSMPPAPDPEPFTPRVTEDNASSSRRVSDYDYEMDFSAEYSDHRSAEYYTEASYRRAENLPAPYLDASTTDWDADPPPVEVYVTAYEHSGQTDAGSPDILPEERASDAQYLEHNEAFNHSEVSAVTSQYPFQPVRAAEAVTQSAREQGEGSKSLVDTASTLKPEARVSPALSQDSTGHTQSPTSNWQSDSSLQEELLQGQECGTSMQPTDGDLSTATPSAASKNSLSSNHPSPIIHSSSDGNTAAPNAVWESLFTQSKRTAGGEGTSSASGTPGGVWDSLFDEAASADTKHVNRPQVHSGSAAERRQATATEPKDAQQPQGIAESSSPAAVVPRIQPGKLSATEFYDCQSSAATESNSLLVGSVANLKDSTQVERTPHAHATSIPQAATNSADTHKQQYQDPRQHTSAVGEDAGTVQVAAQPTHPESAREMQDTVNATAAPTIKVVSVAEHSHDQAKVSAPRQGPGRHSAVYTAAGAAGASLFLLQSLAPQERTTTQQVTSSKGRVTDSPHAPETEVSVAAEQSTPREEEQLSQFTAPTPVSGVLEASSPSAEQEISSPVASTSSALAPDAAFISRSVAPDEVRSDRENTSTRDILVTADPVLAPEVAQVLPEDGKMVLVTPQMQAPKIQSSMWASERAEDRWREQLPPSARKVVDFAEECGRVWDMMFPKKSEEQLQVEREIRKAVMKGDLHWSALNQVQQGKPIMPEQIAEAKRMAQQ